MPKVNWEGNGEEALTAEDVEGAEDGFAVYTGAMPVGGVYRFKVRRIKFKTSSEKKTKGLSALLILDGSWKPEHRQYDGCPVFDDIWMTKGAAAFVKAFAAGIGVSAADLINNVVVNEDDVVTKIGRKAIKEDGQVVYLAVKRGSYEGNPRLEKAGVGYQIVEGAEESDDDEVAEAKPAKATKATAKAKGKKSKNDDEPPF